MSSAVVYATKRLMLPVKITFIKGTNPAVVRDFINELGCAIHGDGVSVVFKPKVKMIDCKSAMMFSTQIKGPRK